MPHRSEPRLLVLHALRLKGVVETDALILALGLALGLPEAPEAMVRQELDDLVALGWVVERDGLLSGWSLTPAGRAEHARTVGAELVQVRGRDVVESGYERFRYLNPGVLDACSRWQVREVRGQVVRNDHADKAHDARVLADLDAALSSVRPVGDELAEVLDRFSPYTPQLADALGRARAGDGEYVTKPLIPSFHTVWFEMHEDLLVTLGLDRSSETEEVH